MIKSYTYLREEKNLSWERAPKLTERGEFTVEENIEGTAGWYHGGCAGVVACCPRGIEDLTLIEQSYIEKRTEIQLHPFWKVGNYYPSPLPHDIQNHRHLAFPGIIRKQLQSSVAFHSYSEASVWCESREPGHTCQDSLGKSLASYGFPNPTRTLP